MKQISIHRQLRDILNANKEGSYGTQSARENILMAAVGDLYNLGYTNLKITNLRTTHIRALVADWKVQALSVATMKNRAAHLRWLADKLNKQNIVPRTNRELGIPNRCYADNAKNRAKELTQSDLNRITNQRVQLSLKLQRYFGLREEESLKFQPRYADKGDHIVLKDSWCKGKRERTIPIREPRQRQLLDACHQVAGKGSMIPPDKTYKAHKSSFEKYVYRAGLTNMHGYRHQRAQELYQTLTGWKCPKNGGKSKSQMTAAEREKDQQARWVVSRELGHNREEITNVYLGH